jgi:hypothetical protein
MKNTGETELSPSFMDIATCTTKVQFYITRDQFPTHDPPEVRIHSPLPEVL